MKNNPTNDKIERMGKEIIAVFEKNTATMDEILITFGTLIKTLAVTKE